MIDNPYSCKHKRTEPRRQIKKNGARCVCLQCLDCGAKIADLKGKDYNIPSLEEFDVDLRRKGHAAASAAYWATHKTPQEWWEGYGQYLQSEQWKRLRLQALNRDHYRCQECGCALSASSAHIHHLSYEDYNTKGHSSLREVTSLCRGCHLAIHQPGKDVP